MLPANWQERPLTEVVTFNPRHERGLPDDLDVSFVPMPKVSDSGRDLLPHDSRKLADVRRGYTHFRDGDVLAEDHAVHGERQRVARTSPMVSAAERRSYTYYAHAPRSCPNGCISTLRRNDSARKPSAT
jgi:type I restriction enzyme S subunit